LGPFRNSICDENNLKPLTSSHERASLVSAAAVIPALRVYMNVVVVKKHIADSDLSATYRSLVVGFVGAIDEKSIE
jgi:hypothetical protein